MRVFHLQVTEKSHSCETLQTTTTRHTLSSALDMSHVWGGPFWVDFLGWLQILLKQEFTQRGLEFSRHDTASKAYRELPWKFLLSHVTMDPHSWSSRLRKIHTAQSVLGLRQQHGQLPGGSAEGRLLFSPSIQADFYQWKLLQRYPLSAPPCLLCQGSNHQH